MELSWEDVLDTSNGLKDFQFSTFRSTVQEWFTELNPDWTVEEIGEMRPDGDVEIPEPALDSFKVPDCPNCGPGSILKTKVIFFGDNVSRKVVDHCYEKVILHL